MIVNSAKPSFEPITITLESEIEARILLFIMGDASPTAIQEIAERRGYPMTYEEAKTAYDMYGPLSELLEARSIVA
jgi:hypothetical protein